VVRCGLGRSWGPWVELETVVPRAAWTGIAMVLEHNDQKFLLQPKLTGLVLDPLREAVRGYVDSGARLAVRALRLSAADRERLDVLLAQVLLVAAKGLSWNAVLPPVVSVSSDAKAAASKPLDRVMAAFSSKRSLTSKPSFASLAHKERSTRMLQSLGVSLRRQPVTRDPVRAKSSRKLTSSVSRASSDMLDASDPDETPSDLSPFAAQLLREIVPRCWAAVRRIPPQLVVEIHRAFIKADRDDSGTVEGLEIKELLSDIRGRVVSEAEVREFRSHLPNLGVGRFTEPDVLLAFQRLPMDEQALVVEHDLAAIVSAETVAVILELAGLLAKRRVIVISSKSLRNPSDLDTSLRAFVDDLEPVSPIEEEEEEEESTVEVAGKAAAPPQPRRASAKVAPEPITEVPARVKPSPSPRRARIAPDPSQSTIGVGGPTPRPKRKAQPDKPGLSTVRLGDVVVVDEGTSKSSSYLPSSFDSRGRARLLVGRMEKEAKLVVSGQEKSGLSGTMASVSHSIAAAFGCIPEVDDDDWALDPAELETEAQLVESEDTFVARQMAELRASELRGTVMGKALPV
jgi:hypothetical protein